MKDKVSYPDAYKARLLFLLAFLLALYSVCNVFLSIALEDTLLTGSEQEYLSEGWFVETPEGVFALSEASRPEADAVGKPLRLVNILPQSLPANSSLCFQTKNESVTVWVGDDVIFTYGAEPQRAYGHGVGAIWNMAELPNDAAGKTVAVELDPIGGRTGLAPYTFLIGSRGGIISHLLMDNLSIIIIAGLLALIGIAAMMASVVGMIIRRSWAAAVFYFALFVLLSTVWTAADSGLLQFWIPNKGVIYMMFGCSFYLLCTPFALFSAVTLPRYGNLFRISSALSSLYALVRIALYILGVVDFEYCLWMLHIFMGLVILAINVVIWLPSSRRENAENQYLYYAVSALTLIDCVSLFDFYLNDKLDVLRNGYSSNFYLGIFLFVVIMIVGTAERIRLLRQRAFRAEFLERRAYTDDLTGMLNVKGFDDKCVELLAEAPEGKCYAVVDFDVNFFSQYNASNGLDVGDELLRRISADLGNFCRTGELAARQEADHFVALLFDDSVDAIIGRIHSNDITVRSKLASHMLLLSYGIAVAEKGVGIAELRNQALVAKRTVKGNYESNIAVYDRTLHEKQLREVELLSGFEAALANREYVIYLQPKVDCRTEELSGAEALVRRIEPDGTVVGAAQIIDALERKGFVAKLDYYVLERACDFLSRAIVQGRRGCPVSVNFSRVHLYDADFVERIAEIVDARALPHGLIEVELTESVFLEGKNVLSDVIDRLHQRGFKVSIDDFGSGYSSLNFLKDAHVDVIKLDREFIKDFSSNSRAQTIIEHTLHLVQEINISTVAEGVETAQQLEFLRRMGCDQIQGFYYSTPLPEEKFLAKYLPLPADRLQAQY